MTRLAPVGLVLMLASSACSDSSADDAASGTEIGCRDPMDDSFCTQYIVIDEGDLDGVKESCALGGIQEVIDSCPSKDVAGCCVLETAQYTAHQCYYPPSTPASVQDQCTTLGQGFVASP
jgi:hypothetical protein